MFSFQLADKLHMTVGQLWENMSVHELRLWRAFCELEKEYHETQQKAQEAQRKQQEAIARNKRLAQERFTLGG